MLNGQQMGGKRRSAYHYDLWCLKYLPNFNWESLTEEIGAYRAVAQRGVLSMLLQTIMSFWCRPLPSVESSTGMTAKDPSCCERSLSARRARPEAGNGDLSGQARA
jgi:hypothetical protein